ncbi:hypothetical protein [Sphingomonas sp. LT1P40]|uniref:hypothetical protein n=1 Tax=Alteristakelama amylovorans TaxID=3096166 RepID=UPI002FCA756A
MSRMLFVGIDYYHYIPKIREAFGRLGFESDWYPIENAGFWAKTFKKFAPSAYRARLDAYHRRMIEATAGTHYDVVLFIQCHHVSLENMRRLRQLHPAARFVLYNWDSLTTHDYQPWLPLFDRAATFDPVDAAKIGITYLPLFAIRDYFEADKTRAKDFDLYFVGAIGSLHRFDALARLHDFCQANGIRTHFHLKCSPAVRLMLWRKRKSLPGLTLASLSFGGIIDLIERSRGVFDFANHKQTGYTMRFIENMCADQKIVTENARVLDEDFYRADRILVIRDFDFSGVKDFLARPITSQLDTERFSIDSWAAGLVEG